MVLDKATKELKRIPFGVTVWATGVGARPLTQKLATTLGASQRNCRALTTSTSVTAHGLIVPCSETAISSCDSHAEPKTKAGMDSP